MLKQRSTLANINSDVTWGPSFLCATKGGGQSRDWKGAMIGQLWPASRGGLTAQLLSGCLTDTGHTLLTNEGACPVHWSNLSTSWPAVNEINLKFY